MGDGPSAGPTSPLVIASDPPPRHPLVPDPSSSSTSSKRRWSPCTWRYAIEEGQPELGSKHRSSYLWSAPSALARASGPPKKWASAGKASEGLQSGCDQIPSAGQNARRQSLEKGGAFKKQEQKEAELEEETMGTAKKKENRTKRVEASRSKRRKRELTPSELYFCEECAQKLSNRSGSPVGDCGWRGKDNAPPHARELLESLHLPPSAR